MYTRIKTPVEIAAMRESGRMLATVLDKLAQVTEPGMSTLDLAEIAKQELKPLGGQPTFLGYYGFPHVLCVSVNDEVVHGIPHANKLLTDGDIVSLDFGVTYQGMITDSAISVIVGTGGKPAARRLVSATELALTAGIQELRDGIKIGDVASAIQKVLDDGKYGIVRDLVGHGVGHELHEDPNLPNFGRPGQGSQLRAGMTVALEPMATLGGYQVSMDPDGWTVRTLDRSWAAHFEHTVLITDDGAEILTTL